MQRIVRFSPSVDFKLFNFFAVMLQVCIQQGRHPLYIHTGMCVLSIRPLLVPWYTQMTIAMVKVAFGAGLISVKLFYLKTVY